jgi:hypothetical protein
MVDDRIRLFKRQAHAYSHLVVGETSVVGRVAACPLCLGVFGDGDVLAGSVVGVEHAPPRQRTRLGRQRSVCLTHRDCNTENAYEARSGRYRAEIDRLRSGEPAILRGRVDGLERWVTLIRRPGALHLVSPASFSQSLELPAALPIDAQLTELKAAYIIAFTVLGYTWAASPAVDPVRAVIRTGAVGQHDGIVPLCVIRDPEPDMNNTVIVSDAFDSVVVVGDDPRWGVLLPGLKTAPRRNAAESLSIGGPGRPWLSDRWWRDSDAPCFVWDCDPEMVSVRPKFLIELGDTA